MRNAFAATLTELATADERVVLLSGDIGNRLFDPYKQACPGRFLNCGVAEANMTGMAAGMAMEGLRPFTYTITPFATLRAMEQIRDDICYPRLPVVIVGTGSGLSYASLGPTHHSCEDIAMLRSLPGMTVVCPADRAEVTAALPEILAHDGPVYLRLGKKGEPDIHEALPAFEIGKSITLRPGHEICIVAAGPIVSLGLDAAAILADAGISCRVESFHTVKPLDTACLGEVFQQCQIVATLEEHSTIGGLGGAVAEWRAERPRLRGQLERFGTDDRFFTQAGSQAFLREAAGLTAEAIAQRLLAAHTLLPEPC